MNYQREYPRRLRAAMIGIGSHAYRNLLPALNYLPVELAAVCNRSSRKEGERTAAQYGCAYYQDTAELYRREKPEAVFLCVSPQAHPALAKEAFAAGAHVFIEKPPAVRAGEIEELIRLRGDRVCVVGYKKAFMPAAVKARQVAQSGDYGRLLSALAVYPVRIPPNGRELLETGAFSDFLGNGCHPLSFLIAVCGRPLALTAHTGADGTGSVCIEFEGGITGTLCLASGPRPVERYSLFGERYNLHIDNAVRVSLNRGIPFEYGRTESFLTEDDACGSVVWEPQNGLATLENKALFVQGIVPEMRYFCDCALQGVPAGQGSLEFALEVQRAYEAAMRSEGARIELGGKGGAE